MTRPGPKPGPQGARTARLVVRVTPAELSAYQAAAGRAGVSMGEWVRDALEVEIIAHGRRTSDAHTPEEDIILVRSSAPRPPEELVGALQDRIHPASGRLLAAKPVITGEHGSIEQPAAAEKEHGG